MLTFYSVIGMTIPIAIAALALIAFVPFTYDLVTHPEKIEQLQREQQTKHEPKTVTVLGTVEDWGTKCVFELDGHRYTTFNKCLYSKGETMQVSLGEYGLWYIAN